MVTGISLPFRVNSTGGVALSDKDDKDSEVIKVALGDGDNENAFQQDITLGKEQIFRMSDEQVRSSITTRLKRMFRNFEAEKRFKLLVNTIEWEVVEDSGEQQLNFRYINLESDEEKPFTHNFKGS